MQHAWEVGGVPHETMTDIDTVRRFIENTSDEGDPMAHEALKALARLQEALDRLIDDEPHVSREAPPGMRDRFVTRTSGAPSFPAR